jgi:mannose-6-phosphate isomerase-like protein (cupin superfamily)
VKARWVAMAGLVCAAAALAADSVERSAARRWTRADLQALDAALISQMGQAQTAFAQVLSGDTHGMLLIHREVTADPELHEKLNDFFVVLEGEGAVKVGGTVSGARTVKPNEQLAQRLDGGTLYEVRQGDVLFVPANVWHQVMVGEGKKLSAILIKAE